MILEHIWFEPFVYLALLQERGGGGAELYRCSSYWKNQILTEGGSWGAAELDTGVCLQAQAPGTPQSQY